MSKTVKIRVANRELAARITAKKHGVDYDGLRKVANIQLTYGIP